MKYFLARFLYVLIFAPVVLLIGSVFFWLPQVRRRIKFEKRNGQELNSMSFSELTEVKADMAFEFSSEGEYQQVASIIDDALKEGKRLELIFFSESLEKTMLDLARMHCTQIRILRFPLFTFGFFDWITAPVLCLVRYDFFLEFLVWRLAPQRKLILFWATFKKERSLQRSVSFFKKLFLKKADLVFFATQNDLEDARKLGFEGKTFDFRMIQIKRRLDQREEKFCHSFPCYKNFYSVVQQYPVHKRLILGNSWPEDIFLLKDLPSDILVVIVPHQLKPEIITQFKIRLLEMGRPLQEINESIKQVVPCNTYLVNQKGILCELYSDFGRAYIGGGFGVSVHSILEPLVAGVEFISCGPRHFRSTEFDLAQQFNAISEVTSSKDFLDWINTSQITNNAKDELPKLLSDYSRYYKEIIRC